MNAQDIFTAIREKNWNHADFQSLISAIECKATNMSAECDGMATVVGHLVDAFGAMDDVYAVDPSQAAAQLAAFRAGCAR